MVRVICLSFLVAVCGCAAIRSTPVTRQDDHSYCAQCPANGVPVTIKVPTHLKVEVYEQLFFEFDGTDTITLVNSDCKRNLKVRSEQLTTEKVIFVDVKRPAAGTLGYNLEFDSKGQSITQYESFLFDRTLEDSANLIAALVPDAAQQTRTEEGTPDNSFAATAGTATSAKVSTVFADRKPTNFASKDSKTSSASFDENVFTRERVVAYKIFDINGVDFEQQLERFVCTHLNACHNCQSNPNGSQNSKSIETAPGDPAVASSKTYEATPTSNDIKTSIKFGPSSSIHNGALDNSAPSRTPHMISNSVSEFEFTVQQSQ